MPFLRIDYSASEGQLVTAALGKLNGYTDANGPRSATEAEVKKALIGVMRGWVHRVAHQEGEQNISLPAFDPT